MMPHECTKGLGLSVKDLCPNLGLSKRWTMFLHSWSPSPFFFPPYSSSLPPGVLKAKHTKVHLVFATLLQNMDLADTTLRSASVFAASPDPVSTEHGWDRVEAQGCSLAAGHKCKGSSHLPGFHWGGGGAKYHHQEVSSSGPSLGYISHPCNAVCSFRILPCMLDPLSGEGELMF